MTTTKQDVQAAEAVLAEVQRPHERQPLGSPRGQAAARARIAALWDALPDRPEVGVPGGALTAALRAIDADADIVEALATARSAAIELGAWARDMLDGAASAETQTAATQAPQPAAEPLHGEALIARKKLAGAGRNQEPGTTFGSRWTAEEREALQELFHEHGRRAAAGQFAAAHPHRTVDGGLYQIDRHLTKRA